MATAKPTPEEKLFAVIQGASHPPVRQAQQFSLRRMRTSLSALVASVDLPRVNYALLIAVLGLGALCLLQPLLLRPRLNHLLARARTPLPTDLVPPLQGLRPLDVYLSTMVQQDPFHIGERAQATAAQVNSSTAPDAKALVADLKVVGISWGDEPVAMIEQHGQTYFLKRGDAIGQVTVKEIQKDRLIVTVNGQDVEIY